MELRLPAEVPEQESNDGTTSERLERGANPASFAASYREDDDRDEQPRSDRSANGLVADETPQETAERRRDESENEHGAHAHPHR